MVEKRHGVPLSPAVTCISSLIPSLLEFQEDSVSYVKHVCTYKGCHVTT